MKCNFFLSIFFAVAVISTANAQSAGSADFQWGNGFFYSINVGESIIFNQLEIKLLNMENHYNLLKVGEDTLWLKVARRSVPLEIHGIRMFVADNKAARSLNPGSPAHNLLKKDMLLCLSKLGKPLLEPEYYTFPVSFNNGFTWNAEEDSYVFSFYKTKESSSSYISYPGIGFNLHDARGLQKHWLIAIENSRVVWVENRNQSQGGNQGCVLLESVAQPGVYYFYDRLYVKNLAVKQGQKLLKGDAVGTAWGDDSWGHLHFAVIHSEKEPNLEECAQNIVNGFPQLFGLYFQQVTYMLRSFNRGKIVFGGLRNVNRNQLNNQEFEAYSGKGWITGKWNTADKVESVGNGSIGNVRLKKILFEGTAAQSKNPEDKYGYRIVVPNGTYRIRAKVGDAFFPSWQKIEFEGIEAGTKKLEAGNFSWTGERIVKVTDGTLDISVYVDSENNLVAGLSEIVFQAAD